MDQHRVGFGAQFAKTTMDRTATTAKKRTQRRISHSAMLIFHSSFNVVRIYVMHVYCLTEINTLNLTTIYKVFAYVIFHDKIYTHTHIRWGIFFRLRLAIAGLFVRSFILLHFACWFLLICSHIKCEIMYRQQRTFIKTTCKNGAIQATHRTITNSSRAKKKKKKKRRTPFEKE